jgi:succinyl-diaminopimelate desuccinylase
MRRASSGGLEVSVDAGGRILNTIAERQDEWLRLVAELVRRPSPNPPGDTGAAAACVVDFLRGRARAPRIVTPRPGMVNVVTQIENGTGRHLILNGHLDTFPVGDPALWDRDPFSGDVVDGKIFGRGVSDMKAGVAASIAALCLLGEVREAWRGTVTLAVVADEETMGPWGANYLVDHDPKLRGDAALIGEPSTPRTVRFGERGMLWIRLRARGQSAHGAYPHQGWNAIFAVTEALAALRELEGMTWPVPPDIVARVNEARAATDALLGSGATDTLTAVTVNAGFIAGGTKVNLVADRCEAEVDIRLAPGVTTGDILRHVGRVVRRHRGMSYEILHQSEPNWTSPDLPFMQVVRDVVTRVRGEAPFFNIASPGTDSRVFRRVGIPVAVFGPTPYGMGAANEHVTVEDFLDTVRVHALAAVEFLRA